MCERKGTKNSGPYCESTEGLMPHLFLFLEEVQGRQREKHAHPERVDMNVNVNLGLCIT